MAAVHADEIRVRVTIDREIPELFARLGNSKRQAREVVHLLRLGHQFEQMLSGKAPWFMAAAPVASPPGVVAGQAASPQSVVSAPASGSSFSAGVTDAPSAEQVAELTGLTADYFASAPTEYTD